MCGGRDKSRKVGESAGRSDEVYIGRVNCMERCDDVHSLETVYWRCGKCVEVGASVVIKCRNVVACVWRSGHVW